MNRISQCSLLALFFLCGVLPCTAQTTRPGNEPLPPPANDSFPQRWKEYVPPDSKFKVSFPSQPKEEAELTDTPNGKKIQIHKISYSSFIYYGVQYMDWPWLMSDPARLKDLFDMERKRAMRFASGGGGQPLSETDITV